MEASHVLVIHNEAAIRRLAADSISQERVRVSLASNGEEGLSLLERERVHVLVAWLDMFGIGDEFVRRAATIQPLLAVVLMVDKARIDAALQRAQPGPVQYLPAPVTKKELRSAVRGALQRQVKRGPAPAGREEAVAGPGSACTATNAGTDRIIAASKAMREILHMVPRCARTDAPVLICGEPDTGKELIAEEIHRQSRRAAGPFVRIACGALRESDLAETLFGHRRADRGAETPAALLEQAREGTLFLENVAQLPLWCQVELLDVLQQGQADHARTHEGAAVDVRVIASTATDLHTATAQRAFSSSLYYYLNVVQIHVPPLRHRPQDIRPLAEARLATVNALRARQGAGGPCRFAEDAWQCLVEYDWPGNILQLASVVRRAALLADGEPITRAKLADALGEVVPQGDADCISVPLLGNLKEIERAVIEAVIQRCGGNKAAAARALGLHRRTLYRILQDEGGAKEEAMPLAFALDANAAGYAATACS
jgi:DNA-binding NtrC family response regulator